MNKTLIKEVVRAANASIIMLLCVQTWSGSVRAESSTDDATVLRLIVQADKEIRQGIEKLAKEFPQLNKTYDGDLEKALKAGRRESNPYIEIGSPGSQFKRFEKTAETFVVTVHIFKQSSEPFDDRIQRWPASLYKNLHLVGFLSVAAEDEKLDKALNDLVKNALKPIEILNTESGDPRK